jgi:ferric-dicitrate binding protein FerR (iron transport regulator)
MTDHLPFSADLLGRFLAGEASEREAAAVRRHLAAHPGEARLLARALAELDAEDGRPAPPDPAASWAALRRRMHEEREEAGLSGDSRAPGTPLATARERAPTPARAPRLSLGGARGRRWPLLLTLPAAVAAGIAAVLVADARRPAAPMPPRVYETEEAQRAELLLSDGTRVRIAPASRLRVAADYAAERRDVWLEGEAYFDVVHDERRPFTVYSGNASARDLGTAFAVRSYAEDEAVQVVVREGVVALSGVGTLGAGDVGRLAADGTASVRSGADVEAMLGWLEGRHDFVDAPLGHVLLTLRRWYGVEVALADSALAALPFTGTLGDIPPRAAIDLVAATLGLRARRGDDGGVRLEHVPGLTPRSSRSARSARGAPSA